MASTSKKDDNATENNENKRILKLVADLVTAKEKKIDEHKLKNLKKCCKSSDDVLSSVNSELFKQIAKNNADIRVLCLTVFDELFRRSHLFRTLTIERFEELTILCTGVDSLKPLPLPKLSAKQLQSKSIELFKQWIDAYVEGYPKLKIVHEALKRRVNFSSNTLLNDVDEMRREADREREATLWRGRVLQVEKEVTENQDAMDQCIQESKASIELWQDGGSPGLEDVRTTALCDQYNVLYRRYIPLCKTWTVTLTKAGRHTQHELLRKCVEIKRNLDSLFETIVNLGINFEKINASRTIETKQKRKTGEEELFSDPTTFAANVKKYEADFPTRTNFLSEAKQSKINAEPSTSKKQSDEDPKESTSKASTSELNCDKNNIDTKSCDTKTSDERNLQPEKEKKSSSSKKISLENVPVIKMSELVSEYKVERNMDLETVWLNGERAESAGASTSSGIKRVLTLSEEFVPVTRSCRFPLDNGSLCPRRDRYKCPFHGVIVNRDEEGQPSSAKDEIKPENSSESLSTSNNADSSENQATTTTITSPKTINFSPAKKDKKPRKTTKLLSVAKEADTARHRLQRKVFHKAAVKRVAARMDASDHKRAKSMFSEQFNYSM
eukprot:TRINITY_DN4876_c0_g1_i5.p1 TRINITY_DN4876_c0_g1~~TRINITY_DN4876_c0_g1_i5.p1  ORF type:complete len:613 (-),score=108.34 TRINITY_DN4876_c0_g1_i5:378-2216(-)